MHRHWAWAEFKEKNFVKAIRKVRKGCQKDPRCCQNWVVWGVILRTVGKFDQAQHKLEKALRLEPYN